MLFAFQCSRGDLWDQHLSMLTSCKVMYGCNCLLLSCVADYYSAQNAIVCPRDTILYPVLINLCISAYIKRERQPAQQTLYITVSSKLTEGLWVTVCAKQRSCINFILWFCTTNRLHCVDYSTGCCWTAPLHTPSLDKVVDTARATWVQQQQGWVCFETGAKR